MKTLSTRLLLCITLTIMMIHMVSSNSFGQILDGTSSNRTQMADSNIPAQEEASITGQVTNMDGNGIAGIEVIGYRQSLCNEWEEVTRTSTDNNGNYMLSSLEEGTYRVYFDIPTYLPERIPYVAEYYPDITTTIQEAANILVISDIAVSGINAQLESGGAITGKVINEQGEPLTGIYVTARRYNETTQQWLWNESASTDENGNYQIKYLAAGTYRVRFADNDYNQYIDEYFGDVNSVKEGSDVSVVDGQIASNINASLVIGGQIMGTVSDQLRDAWIEGLDVDVYSYDPETGEQNWIDFSWTDEDGSYAVGGLLPGIYQLVFAGGGFVDGSDYYGYASEYYNNSPNIEQATAIEILAKEVITDINADLMEGSAIHGQVNVDNNEVLNCLDVKIYRLDDSWEEIVVTNTDEEGDFNMHGLDLGEYRIEVEDRSRTYAQASSDVVTISSAGEWVENILITMNTAPPAATSQDATGQNKTFLPIIAR